MSSSRYSDRPERASSSTLIARIRRSRTEEVRVSVDRWRGLNLVNVRVWYEADDGSMRPGRQGIALRLDLLDEFRAALDRANAVDLDGWTKR